MDHILIVEDEDRMAQTLVKGLEKNGFKTTVIKTGLVARVADISNFDVVILDWMLPGFAGVDILRYWRSKQYQTPILMLTAKDTVVDRVQGLEMGADDYMGKFFEWPELIARLQALIRRSQRGVSQVGSIVFDRVNSKFMEDGKEVELTATEYRLLAYFFDHSSRLITRTNLYQAVYDQDHSPASNVIERHIKSIRKKFSYDPIYTIRGLGYRLKA